MSDSRDSLPTLVSDPLMGQQLWSTVNDKSTPDQDNLLRSHYLFDLQGQIDPNDKWRNLLFTVGEAVRSTDAWNLLLLLSNHEKE